MVRCAEDGRVSDVAPTRIWDRELSVAGRSGWQGALSCWVLLGPGWGRRDAEGPRMTRSLAGARSLGHKIALVTMVVTMG